MAVAKWICMIPGRERSGRLPKSRRLRKSSCPQDCRNHAGPSDACRRTRRLTARASKSARCVTVLRAILLLLLMAGAAQAKPNLLLIVSEDNGPELGCYGDPFARTPRLDRLAADGVRFERAFVPYSVCSPSRAAFLTGLYPRQNGQIGLATHKFALYDPDTPNAFTLLKAAGYRTGLIGKLHVNPESAFPVDFRRIPGANFHKRNVEEYAAAAGEFFNASQRPFFLSINYPDAHLPFLRQQFGRPDEPLTGGDVKPLPWVGIDSLRLREVTADYYRSLRFPAICSARASTCWPWRYTVPPYRSCSTCGGSNATPTATIACTGARPGCWKSRFAHRPARPWCRIPPRRKTAAFWSGTKAPCARYSWKSTPIGSRRCEQ